MTEDIWKISFFVLFIVWFLVRAYYGKKAQTGKQTEKIRPVFESCLVGLNFIGMMILPLAVVFTPWLDGFSMHLPDSVRLLFLVIGFFNVWLFAKIHADLGKNWSPVLEIKQDHTLVKSGIYKRIRHPMYAHIWLWVIGQGIILDNSLVLVFGVAAWGLLYYLRVPKEEEMLVDKFGDEYREYMKTTGRVIPKI